MELNRLPVQVGVFLLLEPGSRHPFCLALFIKPWLISRQLALLAADQLERASELLESGETHRNIADLLGVHRTTLTRNLAT